VSLRLLNDSVPTADVGKNSEGYGHNLSHGLFLPFGERAPQNNEHFSKNDVLQRIPIELNMQLYHYIA